MRTKEERKDRAKIAVMNMLLDDIQYHPTDQMYADGALNALDAILKCIDSDSEEEPYLNTDDFLRGKTWTLNCELDKNTFDKITGLTTGINQNEVSN